MYLSHIFNLLYEYLMIAMAEYWQGLHDTIRITIHGSRYNIPQYIMMRCMLQCIAIFDVVHWKCENRAEIHVAVYDLLSLHTSLHIILIIQQTKRVKTINSKIFLNLFRCCQTTEHTDVAAVTSKWKMRFKCTLALFFERTHWNRGGWSSQPV